MKRNDEPGDETRIKSRMASIRGELRQDAADLQRSTSRFLDWTAHVREHPLSSIGVVAALAYYLVPKRVEITSPDADEMSKLAKDNKVVVEANPTPKPKSSVFGGLTSLVTHTVLRGAMGLIAHEVAKALQPVPGGNDPPERENGRRPETGRPARPKSAIQNTRTAR